MIHDYQRSLPPQSPPPQSPPPQKQLELRKPYVGWKRRFLPFGLLCLSAFLFLVAANTQSGWVMVIASILVAVLFEGWISSKRALKGLEIARQLPRVATAGEACRITITVRNTTARSKYLVQLVEHLPNTLAVVCPQRRFLIKVIPPQGTVTLSYEVESPTRGTHIFAKAELECGFPFGLFTARRRLQTEPALLRLSPRTIPGSATPRSRSDEVHPCHSLPAKGQSDDFYGLRDYVYGDTLRMVHWPASAHAGNLQVRENQAEAAPQRLVVALDTTRYLPLLTATQDDLESALRLTASLLSEAERHGQQVVLGTVWRGQVITAEGYERASFMAALQAELNPAGPELLREWLLSQRTDNCQLVYLAVPGTPQPQLSAQLGMEDVWLAEIGPGTVPPTLYLELKESGELSQRRYLPIRSRSVPLTWRRQAQEWEPFLPASFGEGRRVYQADSADEERTLAFLMEAL